MKTTIEQKIIPAIVIAVSLVLSALGTYTYLSSKAALLKEAHKAVDEAVSRLTISLASLLWDLNNSGAQEFIAAEMTSSAVTHIIVHDAKGSLFAGKARDASGAVVEQREPLKAEAADKVRTVDIIKDGEKIGSVELHFTDEFVRSELRALLTGTLSQVVIIDLTIVAILILLIRRVVTRPLNSVVERLIEISEGDGDLTVSLPEEGAHEISLLARSFNTFVAKTRAVIDQVKDMNMEVVAAAEQLSGSIREIAKSNDDVSHQSKSLAAAAEEMSATVIKMESDSNSVRKVS